MKRLKAKTGTLDGRVTKGKVYQCGGFIYIPFDKFGPNPGLRAVVYDNKQEWMTYNPNIFEPELK